MIPQRALTLVVLLVAALAVAAPALAFDRMLVRDEVVPASAAAGRGGAAAGRPAPKLFNLLGLHWQGRGTVWFRTALRPGAWSSWKPASPEADDQPDWSSSEAQPRRGWKLGNPYWTGSARYVDYRFAGRVRRLRAHFVWSDPVGPRPGYVFARAAQPRIATRAEWGADEAIVRDAPSYAPRVRFSVVHHTAGTNSYTASQSAAIVRGIHRYHVLGNGWDDIGYNFLVDKYGQVFEGRGGGIAQNVVGAHAQGFNTGSVGVALLGSYESATAPPAALSALTRLLAWRLDVAHVNPVSRLTWTSGGNTRFPAGTKVSLRAVAGHRDTGPTSCPGTTFYGRLPALARSVATTGLPKLYDPEVSGRLGGPVRVTGRLSSALPWTVRIANGDGAQVAQGTGNGTVVDWTWNASAIQFGLYSYTVAAGSSVLPATGVVPGPPPLVVAGLSASPRALTPNGDGVGERTSVAVTLSTSAAVTLNVTTESGTLVRTLASNVALPAGRTWIVWKGRSNAGHLAADGRYQLRVSATSPGQTAARTAEVVVDRTLGSLSVAPSAFSPNRDGRADRILGSFNLDRAASVRVHVRSGRRTVAILVSGGLAPGAHGFSWDGSAPAGVLPDGTYRARVSATTSLGTRKLGAAVLLDTVRPRVRIVSARRSSGRTVLRLWLSESSTLRIRYGTPGWRGGGSLRGIVRAAGRRRVVLPGLARQVRVVALDGARNRSKPAVRYVG